jgi:hypothetical protein
MPLFERLDRRLAADEALKLQLPNFSFPEYRQIVEQINELVLKIERAKETGKAQGGA